MPRIREGVGGVGPRQLGDVDDLARDGPVDRGGAGAGRDGQQADPLGVVVVLAPVPDTGDALAVAGHVDGGLGGEHAGVDAHHRQVPGVGVGDRADRLGEQRALDRAELRVDGLVVGVDDERQRAAVRVREAPVDQAEDLLGADAVQPYGDDREEVAVVHGRQEGLDDLVVVQLVAVEVALEQGVVLGLGDDRLDVVGAEGLDEGALGLVRVGRDAPAAGVVVHVPGQQAHVADDLAVLVLEGQIGGVRARAEGRRDGVEGGLEVGLVGVELRDDDRPRHAGRGALGPQRGGDRVEAVGGADDEDGPVRRPQAGPQLAGEVGVAGRVEQVDDDVVAGRVVVVDDAGQRERARAFGVLLVGAVVGDAGPQEVLEQRGLAAAGGADEDDVAEILRTLDPWCGVRL